MQQGTLFEFTTQKYLRKTNVWEVSIKRENGIKLVYLLASTEAEAWEKVKFNFKDENILLVLFFRECLM